MKIQESHIVLLKKEFAEIDSKQDFLVLLNLARKLQYGEDCKLTPMTTFNYYTYPKNCKKRYTEFQIPKKTGGFRTINAPVKGLRNVLKDVNFVFQCLANPHKAATGFVLNKSIVDNAQKHVGKLYVYNIDLKDFFHSFTANRVKLALMKAPFGLNNDLAFCISLLVTHEMEIDGEKKMVLPQGSPVSPTLTNILCKKLDKRLTGLAHRFGLNYTRYADDITFSSDHNVYADEEFLTELHRIIKDDNKYIFPDKTIAFGNELKINDKKTRLRKRFDFAHQEVTGLVVNEKVNVTRKYVKQIRQWLYFWERYGYQKAEELFREKYKDEKGHVKKGNPNFVNVLDGKLLFMKMVKGEEDATYTKLKERFDKLTGFFSPIDRILNTWEKEGIEKAIIMYDKIHEKTQEKPYIYTEEKGLAYLEKYNKDPENERRLILFNTTVSSSRSGNILL